MGYPVRRRPPNVDRIEQRRLIATALVSAEPGATVTYAELGSVIGLRDIRQIWHVLNTARNDVRLRDGISFEPIVNVGLRRLG